MALRAAVASSDGIVINRHFGKADSFLIFELDNEKFQYIETREVTPCCNLGTHEDNAFEQAAQALNDCSIIIVSKIGTSAAGYLETRGFTVYESPFKINDVLNLLIERSET